MGIHTGQAVGREGQYTGLAVHRAARICAAGHGGQVLVSQATQTLLEDEEEDLEISLRDLGEHRLKDFDRPVRLYQAGAEGLPSTFPVLQPSGAPSHAVETAVNRPLWRRPGVLAATALAFAALLAAAVVMLSRSAGGGDGEVQPNHVGVIDPETNKVVAEVAVGSDPGPVATGAGSIWVGNLDDRTITRISLEARPDCDRPARCPDPDGARVRRGRPLGRARLARTALTCRSPVEPGNEDDRDGRSGVDPRGSGRWCRIGVGRLRRLDARLGRP